MAYKTVRPEPSPWVEARQSGVHGHGLFAAKAIPKGTRIMEYGGRKVPKKVGTALTERQWTKGHVTVFTLNTRWDLDGSPAWNVARLANHSCHPNAEAEIENGRRIWIVAMRAIRKGEEITYDYGFDFTEPPVVCRCGARDCIGYLVGEHDLTALHAWLQSQEKPVPAALAKRVKPAKRSQPARAAKAAKGKKGGKAPPSPRTTEGRPDAQHRKGRDRHVRHAKTTTA